MVPPAGTEGEDGIDRPAHNPQGDRGEDHPRLANGDLGRVPKSRGTDIHAVWCVRHQNTPAPPDAHQTPDVEKRLDDRGGNPGRKVNPVHRRVVSPVLCTTSKVGLFVNRQAFLFPAAADPMPA